MKKPILVLILFVLVCLPVQAQTSIIVFDNLEEDQVVTADVYQIKGKANLADIEKIEIAVDEQLYLAECLDESCAKWQYAWVVPSDGIHFVKVRITNNNGEEFVNETIIVYVQKDARFSAEKSVLIVNKHEAYAGLGDSVVALVTVKSVGGELLDKQKVKLTWSSTENKYYGNSAEGETNENGQVAFKIKSKQIGQFLLEATVDSMKIEQTQLVNFLKSPKDYTNGDLVKIASNTAVYFLDSENVLHTYPIDSVYFSYWGEDFSAVETISVDEFIQYELGENVPYKSGSLMKTEIGNKVYRVADNAVLNWIETEEVAVSLYGSNWNQLIYKLPAVFFSDYTLGDTLS